MMWLILAAIAVKCALLYAGYRALTAAFDAAAPRDYPPAPTEEADRG